MLYRRPGWTLICFLTLGVFLGTGATALAASSPWTPPFWISAVEPHDAQGQPTYLAQSQLVDIGVWPSSQVTCSTDLAAAGAGGIGLYVAKNNGVAERIPSPGRLVLRTVSGVTFPSLQFKDLSSDLADDPKAQYRFTTWAGNVWVNATDPRTFLPNPVIPIGYAAIQPGDLLDSRIQIVWPRDDRGNFAPVDQATRVNVAVDLFAHGTLKSVTPDYDPYHGFSPTLFFSEGDGPVQRFGGHAQKISYFVHGDMFPRWVFNDVPVSPGHLYNFLAVVTTDLKKASVFTTIWPHAPAAQPDRLSPRFPPPCALTPG